MKILIIGDRHVGGYGLSAGQLSFVGHFLRQISHTGQAVSVEAYAHSTLSAARATLAQLPLERYDLIIIQAGQGCVDHPAGLGSLLIHNSDNYTDVSGDLVLPACLQTTAEPAQLGILNKLSNTGKLLVLKALASLGKLPRLHTVQKELTDLLAVLHPYRHKTILLTPFSHREPVSQWLRQQGRALFMKPKVWQSFSVFDSDSIILPREEYFLINDDGYLSAIGHELLGKALFDFYVAAPTIVAIHPIRRS